jgi:hypothetical protein
MFTQNLLKISYVVHNVKRNTGMCNVYMHVKNVRAHTHTHIHTHVQATPSLPNTYTHIQRSNSSINLLFLP